MDGYVKDILSIFRAIDRFFGDGPTAAIDGYCGSYGGTMEQRYSMVQDDDGHTYIINAADRVEFETLLEGDEDGLWTRFHNRFGGNMLNWHPSGYTFTDPRTATGEELYDST